MTFWRYMAVFFGIFYNVELRGFMIMPDFEKPITTFGEVKPNEVTVIYVNWIGGESLGKVTDRMTDLMKLGSSSTEVIIFICIFHFLRLPSSRPPEVRRAVWYRLWCRLGSATKVCCGGKYSCLIQVRTYSSNQYCFSTALRYLRCMIVLSLQLHQRLLRLHYRRVRSEAHQVAEPLRGPTGTYWRCADGSSVQNAPGQCQVQHGRMSRRH